MPKKLGKPTDQRLALIRGQVTDLLWYGRIETTLARAKSVQRKAEKIITLAIDTYEDIVEKVEERKDAKGKIKKITVQNDGVKKLAARRKIMAQVYDMQEPRLRNENATAYKNRTELIKHPLLEKIFNDYAPKYAKRAEEIGQKGGYTRIVKCGPRRGDAGETVILELV